MKTTACIKLLALLLLAACDGRRNSRSRVALRRRAHHCGPQGALHRKQRRRDGGHHARRRRHGQRFLRRILQDARRRGCQRRVSGPDRRHPTRFSTTRSERPFTIFCNGLTLGDYGGKIQLGVAPDGDYGVGRIPREELGRYLRRNPDKDRRPRPAVCTFDAIGPRQTDTYVCFEGVRFTEAGPWCDTDPETSEPQTSERTLTDAQGRTFRVRTLGTCAYATEPVPQGTGSVYGIIDYFNGKYTLRVSERRVEFANAAGLPRAYPSTGRYSAPKPTK